MSAINVFRFTDSVHMLTDCAGYDRTGVLHGALTKQFTIVHQRAVVGTRGAAAATPFLTSALSLGATFDDMVATAARIARDAWTRVSREPVQIFVAGWSESRDRPWSFVLGSEEHEGIPAWTVTDLGPIVAAPVPTVECSRLAGLDLAALTPETFDPVEDGVRLVEAQRLMRLPWPQAEFTGIGVGVAAALTTITREGIAQRILRRWPDKVGQRINPAANAA